MFSIGDFARFAGVSVRTVRYYDEVGLLPPVEVDPVTGYRSYGADQLARLHRITALKELGLSLRQLRPLLDDLDAGKLRGMLELKSAELEDRLAEEHERLARVERCLRAIEKEGAMPVDVVLKSVPEMRVAAVRGQRSVPDFDRVPGTIVSAVLRLLTAVERGVVKPAGPMLVYYESDPEGALEPVAAVPIGGSGLADGGPIVEITLPGVDVATAVREGSPDHMGAASVYTQLHTWAEDHGYAPTGHGRDLILRMPGPDGQGMFEHQLPLVGVEAAADAG